MFSDSKQTVVKIDREAYEKIYKMSLMSGLPLSRIISNLIMNADISEYVLKYAPDAIEIIQKMLNEVKK